jgi:hypothetical protein
MPLSGRCVERASAASKDANHLRAKERASFIAQNLIDSRQLAPAARRMDFPFYLLNAGFG